MKSILDYIAGQLAMDLGSIRKEAVEILKRRGTVPAALKAIKP